jgi:plastocyanin
VETTQQPPGPSKKKRTVSISTVLILVLAAIAGVAYYVGTPASLPPANATSDAACPTLGVQIVIPQGVGSNESIRFEPPTLTVVVGVNNTVTWNDQDTTAAHNVISVSVPPNGVQWYFDGMSGGNIYCVTLTAPGTYTYEVFLSQIVEGTIIVKT